MSIWQHKTHMFITRPIPFDSNSSELWQAFCCKNKAPNPFGIQIACELPQKMTSFHMNAWDLTVNVNHRCLNAIYFLALCCRSWSVNLNLRITNARSFLHSLRFFISGRMSILSINSLSATVGGFQQRCILIESIRSVNQLWWFSKNEND